jgi:RND family efflux transporter MFP subunit
MTKTKIIIVSLLLVCIGGYFYYQSKTKVVVVPTETVRKGSVVETVSVTGELVPVAYSDLSFKGIGTLDAVFVKEGDQVKAGDRVASIDRTVLQSQLSEARIAVRIAEANELLARKTLGSKRETILARKFASEQARESVRGLVTQMKEGMLLAPLDGTVASLDARVGEVVSAGRIIARISRPGDFVIEARVPESDIAKVRSGMQASVTFDAFSTTDKFSARATDIDTAATTLQGVVSYVVKFQLEGSPDRLKEGMTANLDIETAKREGVLTVPFRALFKSGGVTFAEVKRSDASFEKVEVTTGLEGDEGVIEILSGLKEGDEVTIGAKQKN